MTSFNWRKVTCAAALAVGLLTAATTTHAHECGSDLEKQEYASYSGEEYASYTDSVRIGNVSLTDVLLTGFGLSAAITVLGVAVGIMRMPLGENRDIPRKHKPGLEVELEFKVRVKPRRREFPE